MSKKVTDFSTAANIKTSKSNSNVSRSHSNVSSSHAVASSTPSNPSSTPSNPSNTTSNPSHTPSDPSITPFNPSSPPSNPFSTPSDPAITPFNRSSSPSFAPKTAFYASNASLTLRILMYGKEVGSIIGKKGEIVKRIREQSSARINITDGSFLERIVSVIGTNQSLQKAFRLICNKLEDDLLKNSPKGAIKPQITLKLIIPASQCGSIIGKGGTRIKNIRENTGATIQVGSEMLPASTERTVTVSGGSDAITQCIYNICNIMAESPPKGPTIPYKAVQYSVPPPSSATSVTSLQESSATSSYASPPPCNPIHMEPMPLMSPLFSPTPLMSPGYPLGPCVRYTAVPLNPSMFPLMHGAPEPKPIYCQQPLEYGKGMMPAAYAQMNGIPGFGPGILSPAALSALAGTGNCRNQALASSHQTHEMTVPNEIIGCVIGKGGSKIAEIRQLSGAMIRISNCEDRDAPANLDRTITISGNCESVALAQYLINMRISMETAGMGGLAGFQYVSPNAMKAPVH
ncbi:poly(rC)-binding protein 2 [Eurytemora carolleeae]|uniref:poly(rC)-binding protein 2 n=1 Tax=Eurytemora carolleeae TaxID=1294199 RepID=UPI000C776646|nr:poly(rC)-binding protein 2 [Eurytemora carolleeae]|eukprot:XP_023342245.1 poly(rC)-binding protein 2-like [Eurytemora affinis]